MEMGGRKAVYDLMGMLPPPSSALTNKRVLDAPPLVIDRTGETDDTRYKGLKLGQILDDQTMAEALALANEKAKRGETWRSKLEDDRFDLPYADKRNTGPRPTPDWTPERIDEYTQAQGRAIDWARRAKMGDFLQDPLELLDLNVAMRIYLAFTVLELSLTFGRSTPAFLGMIGFTPDDSIASTLFTVLQAQGLALTAANLGSCVLCGAILAPPLNRNSVVWAVKGFLGGPLAVLELRNAQTLITRGESEQQARDAARRNPK